MQPETVAVQIVQDGGGNRRAYAWDDYARRWRSIPVRQAEALLTTGRARQAQASLFGNAEQVPLRLYERQDGDHRE